MSSETKIVGLRSGGVLKVTEALDGLDVDSTAVALEDVAAALAAAPRYNGQLFRPYSAAEHAVLGSHLLEDLGHSIQFLFQEVAVAFGADTPEVAEAIRADICLRFDVPYPFAPEVVVNADFLGALEVAYLHPAKNHILAQHGLTADKVKAKATKTQQAVLSSWFGSTATNRPPMETQWLSRLSVLRRATNMVREVQREVSEWLVVPGRLPFPEKVLAARIAEDKRLDPRMTLDEVNRLESEGLIERRAGFYYLA